MADKNDKHPENVTGKFYVDTQCIDCDLCMEAKNGCPVDAIGDDGE